MPTNNPVPSQDPSDLLFNAGKLDEVLNGTGNSFTDRLGVARRTVAGMNADFDAQLADAESDLNMYRADAAASAAEALGYLQTIRATSYGAYASDPATDPLGNPPTVGDEYFNTTSNLLKRWNGTTWQASDINTANLAAPSGSSLIGYDGQTVQGVLDGAKSLQDYAALRAYTGRASRICITGLLVTVKPAGITGFFQYDPTDTTSADNGGTIIVLNDGRRFKRDFDGAFNILWFGADRTGTVSSSAAVQAALNAIETRGIGGSVYSPAGVYKLDETVNFYISNVKGIKFFGDGILATRFNWTGGAGRAFTNEMPVSSSLYFQYGVFFEDFTLIGDGVTGFNPTPGSVGLHIEKAQNHWQMHRVRIDRFATNLDVGVHAEAGQLLKCVFGYGDVGVNAYGDQADALVIDSCWFPQNRLRGLILSSPRPVVTNCWFGGRVGVSGYADIQIGYQATRAEDIGKSTYLVAGTGNSAIKARISKNAFEYYTVGDPQILFQNIDSTTKVFDGHSIERNYFASYASPAPIRIIDTFENISFSKNNHASTVGAPFIDCQTDTMGVIDIDEPFIAKLFGSDDQAWKFAQKTKEQFSLLRQMANIAGFGGWSWRTINSTHVTVDVDYDGENSVKISNAAGTPAGHSADILNTSCPAGMVYVSLDIGVATTPIAVDISVYAASGPALYSKRNVGISNSGTKTLNFGFNNPTSQTIYIRFSYRSIVDASGSFIIKEPKIKHADGSVSGFGLIDTLTGSRFTNRSSQIHSFFGRIPYAHVFDYANQATGGWTFGKQVKTTVANAAASGAMTLDVADATNISAGDFIYLKPNIATGVISGHSGSITTGNKVSSKSGNTLTLATGIPFAVDAGNSVIAQTVYTLAARTKI